MSDCRSPGAEKALTRVLGGHVVTPPPVWLMRQAGRYLPEYRALREEVPDFLSFCYAPALAAEATLQPVRRFGMSAAILFADILLVPDALGQEVAFREGEGPVLEAIANAEAIASLRPDGALEHLAPVAETVRRVSAALPAETALIGFAGAPWTVATYMVEGGSSRDYARVKSWAYRAPESFQRLIDLLVEVTSDYLALQIAAGAEAVQLFDSWAGVLSEPEFHRWCVAPTRRIRERLAAAWPDVPVIGFPRGAGSMYPAYAQETGVQGLGLDSGVSAAWAADHLQETCAVQGNMDPRLLVTGGAPMRAEAERLLAILGGGPYIFNLGHGVVPETPPDHVAALVELVRNWNGSETGEADT